MNLRSLLLLFFIPITISAQYYFPEQNEEWEHTDVSEIGWDQDILNGAVQYALDNEYSGSHDLRQAILKGFQYEPFHKILGPTKERGGPAGMILHKGYMVTSWGDIDRVDMTFSVTKSYLSTLAGLAIQNNLIEGVNEKVGLKIWEDHFFNGEHNSKITWDHLLTQSSDWA